MIAPTITGELVDTSGSPVANTKITRTWDWAWTGQRGQDQTVTNENGVFTFPVITGRSLSAQLLPHQVDIQIFLEAATDAKTVEFFSLSKGNYTNKVLHRDPKGVLQTVPLEIHCGIDALPRSESDRFYAGQCVYGLSTSTTPPLTEPELNNQKNHLLQHNSIGAQEAQTLATEAIDSQGTAAGREYVLLPEKSVEISLGWVLPYTTRRHAESGKVQDLVPGLTPIIVTYNGGVHQSIPSSIPPQSAIEQLDSVYTIGITKLQAEKGEAYTNYFLEETTSMDTQSGLWFLRFNEPNSLDAQVEMQINFETVEVINYQYG